MQPLNAETEATITSDLLVAGGGVAGVAAALSAARAGTRVLLVEKAASLGGIGTLGMLGTICGLYRNGNAEPAETLNPGITAEVADVLKKSSGSRMQKIGKVFVLQHAPADLDQVLVVFCRNEPNLTVLLETEVLSVVNKTGSVSEVAIAGPYGRQRVFPRAAIDATGNGNLACMAGAAFELSGPDEIQMAGCSVRLAGIQTGDEGLQIKIPAVLADAVRKNELAPNLRFTTFRPGDAPEEGYLKFSMDGSGDTAREQRMREWSTKAVEILAGRLPAFRNVAIVARSPVLDREGRRIIGRYVLTGEDVSACRKFPDGVVRNSWPIELWDRNKGTVYKYLPDGEYYEIPFRCLRVKDVDNLLTAGRCISVSHEAYASVRVMGCCLALGDVAGRAAAGWIKTGKYPEFDKSKE